MGEIGGVGPPPELDLVETIEDMCGDLMEKLGGAVGQCLQEVGINVATYLDGMCTLAGKVGSFMQDLLAYREFLEKPLLCLDIFEPLLLNQDPSADNGCASCKCHVGCNMIDIAGADDSATKVSDCQAKEENKDTAKGQCSVGIERIDQAPVADWKDLTPEDKVCAYHDYTASAKKRCPWGDTIEGSISGHNIQCYEGQNMESCKELCSLNAACQSIDFKTSGGNCCLGSCKIGDGDCVNDHDKAYKYAACWETKECRWSETTYGFPSGGRKWYWPWPGGYEGETLEGCKKRCSESAACKSVSFRAGESGIGRCWLYRCQIGDGVCTKRGGQGTGGGLRYYYAECQEPPVPDSSLVYSDWVVKKKTCDGTKADSATQASAFVVFGLLAWLSVEQVQGVRSE